MNTVKKIAKVLLRLSTFGAAALLCVVMFTGMAMAAETKIDEKNFPDEGFREYVSARADNDKNGSLSDVEIRNVTSMYLGGARNLKGIEFFTELRVLNCNNEKISGRVDLRKNTKLEEVNLYGNEEITSIDVSGCPELQTLYVDFSKICSLDVSKNPKLKELCCNYTQLQSLDLSNNGELVRLECVLTKIKSLDLSKNTKLRELNCAGNPITKLDLSKNVWLYKVYCNSCALTMLTIGSSHTDLYFLNCSMNNLQSLDLSQATELRQLFVYGNRLTAKTLKLPPTLKALYDSAEGREVISLNYLKEVELPGVKYEGTGSVRMTIDLPVPIGDDISVVFVNDSSYANAKAVNSTTQKSGKEFTIPKIAMNNSWYYFLGWSFAPDATEAQFKTGDKITVYRNTILYPVYKDKTYKATFDLNGGTSGAPAAITGVPYYSHVYFEIPAASPVREGYYFMGWANATEQEHIYKSGDMYRIDDRQDVVFYAVWKPRTNKITFNANGGSGTVPAAISVLSGKEATVPSASVTRSGYWFLGWSTNKNATTATYKSNSKLSVTKDTVLYAVWKSQTATTNCTLTFDANGGTNPPAKITAAQGSTVTIPSASVTRNGYWFLGWATSKTATTAQYKSGNTLTLSANTTLYAVWKKK